MWAPHHVGLIKKIESVQRRASKIVSEMSHLQYTDILKFLGLPTLEYRRLRADMIQVYRIIHGIDNLNINTFFQFNPSSTRGHNYKLDLGWILGNTLLHVES